jgi:hypothetical protein
MTVYHIFYPDGEYFGSTTQCGLAVLFKQLGYIVEAEQVQ